MNTIYENNENNLKLSEMSSYPNLLYFYNDNSLTGLKKQDLKKAFLYSSKKITDTKRCFLYISYLSKKTSLSVGSNP